MKSGRCDGPYFHPRPRQTWRPTAASQGELGDQPIAVDGWDLAIADGLGLALVTGRQTDGPENPDVADTAAHHGFSDFLFIGATSAP